MKWKAALTQIGSWEFENAGPAGNLRPIWDCYCETLLTFDDFYIN